MNETYIDTALKHLREVPQGQYYVDIAIQKTRESFRAAPETKAYLNTLKIK